MARAKKATAPVPEVVEETPEQEPLVVAEYVNNAITTFVAAREILKEDTAPKDGPAVQFQIAAYEALIAIAQSQLLIVQDLHARITAALPHDHTHEEE